MFKRLFKRTRTPEQIALDNGAAMLDLLHVSLELEKQGLNTPEMRADVQALLDTNTEQLWQLYKAHGGALSREEWDNI